MNNGDIVYIHLSYNKILSAGDARLDADYEFSPQHTEEYNEVVGSHYSKSENKEHCKRKPEKPEDDDCCGSGCDPCVFDTYEIHMQKYDD